MKCEVCEINDGEFLGNRVCSVECGRQRALIRSINNLTDTLGRMPIKDLIDILDTIESTLDSNNDTTTIKLAQISDSIDNVGDYIQDLYKILEKNKER